MFIVYAISSRIKDYIYIGFTSNLEERLIRHNKGYEKTTKPYAPSSLIYQEDCLDRISARKREKYLKSGSGRKYLKKIRAGLSTDR